MTVREMIKALSKFDGDKEVIIDFVESVGWNCIGGIEEVQEDKFIMVNIVHDQ